MFYKVGLIIVAVCGYVCVCSWWCLNTVVGAATRRAAVIVMKLRPILSSLTGQSCTNANCNLS